MQRYQDLMSEEVQAQLEKRILFFPLGALEQHGPHLPLSVDVDIAMALATELARRTDGIVAPPVSYGARSLPQSGGGPWFPGTIRIRGAVLTAYLVDILAGFVDWGAHSLVVVNGHYENEAFLFEAIDECRETGRLRDTRILALSWWSAVSNTCLQDLFPDDFPGWHAEHAGRCETSLMLYLKSELVRPDRVDNLHPPMAGVYVHPTGPASMSHRGVLSKTTGSSADIGHVLFHHICDRLEGIVQSLHSPQQA